MEPPRKGRGRVVIEGVSPEIDGGRFPIKRTLGDELVVEADVFADGHDVVRSAVRYRHENGDWSDVPMKPLGNDRWRATFPVRELGRYRYSIVGWIDDFATWWLAARRELGGGDELSPRLQAGARLVERAASRSGGHAGAALRAWAARLRSHWRPEHRAAVAAELIPLMEAHGERRLRTTYGRELQVWVDRERARFSAWYEMFPRSAASDPDRHGTLADVEKRLPYVAEMGFDVLYLPPIHPIGRTRRKGRDNDPLGSPEDPGVPWAIGSDDGGHTAIHPELGTLDDFDRLVESAAEWGIEIALDLAYQCSPDHPWVREHPEWFRRRPDGTFQHAENPPKRYEDIYPLDFETERWEELWEELRHVLYFWIGRGIRIFRADNPHTKPYALWEWLIAEVKRDHPDVIFLSEAFTRPKVMYRLAKLGFTQSYTYFAWRNTKAGLTEYFTELTRTEVREFFRPNLWPATPDILTDYLQTGGRPAFIARLVLAATLGASYGIYGPAFELMEATPSEPGSEEPADSEKYRIRFWDIDRPDSLRGLIGRVNQIRRQNAALQRDWTLRFHPTDNGRLVAYSKADADHLILTVVNLDPHRTQAGSVRLELEDDGVDPAGPVEVVDLLTERRSVWRGPETRIRLDPDELPARIVRVPRVAAG